jgi:hypothetical protein
MLNLFLFVLLFEPPKPNAYQSHPNWQCTCHANIYKPSPSPTWGTMECLLLWVKF